MGRKSTASPANNAGRQRFGETQQKADGSASEGRTGWGGPRVVAEDCGGRVSVGRKSTSGGRISSLEPGIGKGKSGRNGGLSLGKPEHWQAASIGQRATATTGSGI